MPRAFDPKPDNVAVPQLVHLHGRLTAKLWESVATSERLSADLGHVEAVIKLFDPAYNIARIPGRRRNAKNVWFKRGTMFRAALDALRAAGAPMIVADIARAMLVQKGVAEPRAKDIADLSIGLRSCLEKNGGKAVKRVGEGTPARWTILANMS